MSEFESRVEGSVRTGQTRAGADFEQAVSTRAVSTRAVSQNGTACRHARWLGVCALSIVVLAAPRQSAAAVVWSSGFETNDLSDWDYELNPEGLSVVTTPVAAGQYALRAELTSERVWDNGIFRTELQYRPTKSKASEGAETYFGWSIYLPEALPAGDYQLGYWETRATYNQVFSLHAEGADLALVLNHDAAMRKHTVPGLLTVGVWHRIVYHIKWSADPAVGFVSVWFDGTKVVNQAKAQTFVDADPALIQLGLLKDPPAPPQAVVLFVDEAIDGQSYADVSLGIAEVAAVAPVSTDATTGSSSAGADVVATSAAPVTAGTTSAAAATTAAPPSSASNSGCSISWAGGHATRHGGSWSALFALVVFMTTRKRWARRGG